MTWNKLKQYETVIKNAKKCDNCGKDLRQIPFKKKTIFWDKENNLVYVFCSYKCMKEFEKTYIKPIEHEAKTKSPSKPRESIEPSYKK